MNVARRNKLSALTRGAALVGIGIVGTACTKSGSDPQPPVMNAPAPPTVTPPTMNATATPTPSDSSAAGNDSPIAADGDGGIPIRRLPFPNAMRPRRPDAGGTD